MWFEGHLGGYSARKKETVYCSRSINLPNIIQNSGPDGNKDSGVNLQEGQKLKLNFQESI